MAPQKHQDAALDATGEIKGKEKEEEDLNALWGGE
jgi:hypothetical protein